MKNFHLHTLRLIPLLFSIWGVFSAHAQDVQTSLIGKNEWLFYKPEISSAADTTATNTSLSLIQRFNKVLSANGVELAVVMVPLKMRIYAEHLPDEVKLSDYMKGNYERMLQLLRSNQVNAIDINTAFLNSPKRDSDTPLYFRLDTHWTPTGAMVAAETIKTAIDNSASLKKSLSTIPEEKYKITIAKRKRPSRGRDLVPNLPPTAPTFGPELLAQVNIDRITPATEDLLGNRQASGLALLGSSYSIDWTGFADALRYVLQRDILSLGVPADQGSWAGMETYLRDDAYQIKAPKILIWEMPERDMRAPPDYKFRPARYVSDNTEWLLRASAWVQTSCKPSNVKAKITPTGLATNPMAVKGADIATSATNEGDFIEIHFDNPIEKLDYLSARVLSNGSKTITLEAAGSGVATRRFTLTVAGDDLAHALKTPLPSNGRGFNRVRIYPGKSSGFSFGDIQVCRQPEDLLN
jgi:alginate O-acetyltransferase complex protein AlgJ